MQIPKLTFIEFLMQFEDTRIELQEALFLFNEFESGVDCKKWTWGKVKDAQDLISGQLSYKDIFDLAKLESESITEESDYHIVFGLFNSVRKSINELSEIENTEWAHEQTPKEMQAALSVGGFDRFGTMPQTLKLCSLMNMSYNDIRLMDWETCFAAFTYQVAAGEFKTKIYAE